MPRPANTLGSVLEGLGISVRMRAGSAGRETAFFDERLAKLDDFRVVHVEDIDGHPTDRRPADEDGALPVEMPLPLVSAWVKKFGELPADRVESGDVRPLVAIAVEAGQGEVSRGGGAVMLPGDDVVDGEMVRVGRLR